MEQRKGMCKRCDYRLEQSDKNGYCDKYKSPCKPVARNCLGPITNNKVKEGR